MKLRKTFFLTGICLLAAGTTFLTVDGANLVNPAVEKKIDDLLGRMTLEEKVGQLNQYSSTFDLPGPAPEAGAARER